MRFILFALFLNCILLTSMKCATIGLLFNIPSLSNHIMYRSITTGLVERGHKIILITTNPTTEEINHENVTVIDIRQKSYEIWQQNLAHITTANGTASNMDQLTFSKLWTNISYSLAEAQLPEVKQILNENVYKMDVLVGSLIVLTNGAIAKKLNIPYIGIHPYDVSYSYHLVYGNSFTPYHYPDAFNMEMRNPLSWDGINDFINLLAERIHTFGSFKRSNDLMLKHLGVPFKLADCREVLKNIALSIFTSSQLWSLQKPVQQMTRYVGDTHLRRSKILDEDLQKWLDDAKEGVVLFCLGSNIRASTLPKEKVKMLVDAFSELPFKVLLQWTGPLPEGLGNNTKVSAWLEQADVLAHPNIKVFVTHAGLLSINEAIFHRVPLVAIPFFGDQEFNSKRIVDLGLGRRLFFSQLTSGKLRDVIIDVANNTHFLRRIIEFSDQLFDTPSDPVANAIWWIEHVLRHPRTDHLRAETIKIYEYFLLDVIFFVILSAVLTVSLILFLYSYLKYYFVSVRHKKK